MAELPLVNSGQSVVLDADTADLLNGVPLWLLAGRVVAVADNIFVDVRNLLAGDGAVVTSERTLDLRKCNLAGTRYLLGGGLSLVEPAEPGASARMRALRQASEAPSDGRDETKPFRLAPNSMGYLPFEAADAHPNVSVDSVPNAGTVLTLSHWPSNPTPEPYRANLSTVSVLDYLETNGAAAGVDIVTTDHFDIDGLMSVYAFLQPEHALRSREMLAAVARVGDFSRGESLAAQQIAVALDTIGRAAVVPRTATHTESTAAQFAAALSETGDVIDHPERYESLWAEAISNFWHTEAILNHPEMLLEEHTDIDLAVFWLPTRDEALDSRQRYFGLSQVSFHNRTRLSTVALVHDGAAEINQRYEGWVERVTAAPRPRRDLGPFALALRGTRTAPGGWRYDGVENIMPALRYDGAARSSGIRAETVIAELRDYLTAAPAAWQPTMSADLTDVSSASYTSPSPASMLASPGVPQMGPGLGTRSEPND
jgi:hypothetical protein